MSSRNLNIPLESGKARSKTPFLVFGILFTVFVVTLLLWGLFRIWTYRDTTSGLQPKDAIASIHIYKTPQTNELIRKNIGSEPIFHGSPWTFDYLLDHSKNGFTLHFDTSGVISFTTDTVLDESALRTARQANFTHATTKSSTLIAKTDSATENTGTIYRFQTAFPWIDGEVRTKDNVISLLLHEKGLVFRGIFAEKPVFTLQSAPETTVNTWITIPQGAYSTAEHLSKHASFQSLQPLADLVEAHGAELLLGTDAKGDVFTIAIPSGNTDLQTLATLTNEMMKVANLSTLVSTIEDGSTVDELIFDPKTITSNVQTEGSISFIHVQNIEGDAIRATLTPTSITISNRDISLASEEISIDSCSKATYGYISTSNVLRFTHTRPAIDLFSAINLNARNLTLCW